MEHKNDPELQAALALSLEQYRCELELQVESGSSESRQAHGSRKTESGRPLNSIVSGGRALNDELGRRPGTKLATIPRKRNELNRNKASELAVSLRRKRRKKQPDFSPSEAETLASFRELDRSGKGRFGAGDIMETALKLGIDMDEQQAAAMIEWATDMGLAKNANVPSLDIDEFREIIKFFSTKSS